MYLNLLTVKPIVEQALIEDIGFGDITTYATIPADLTAKAVVRVKEDGVIAGLPILRLVYQLVDERVTVTELCSEGDYVEKGTLAAEISGPARAILTGERVALNFMQRLSGIAGKTYDMAERIKYYDCHVTDTRKTTPGLRVLEKYAVRVGRGRNHRFNLADCVLIKDNHIEVCGSISNAVSSARHNIGHTVKVEVEVTSLEQVEEALSVAADIIMLDNMSLEEMSEAVQRIDGRAVTEASGNIDEETIVDVARTGVDYISSGSLTHSFKSLDISMDIVYGEVQ